jgi:hypothetical protein
VLLWETHLTIYGVLVTVDSNCINAFRAKTDLKSARSGESTGGKGYIQWVQYAESNDKRVLEIRKEIKRGSFPGFHTLCYEPNHVHSALVARSSQAREGSVISSFARTRESNTSSLQKVRGVFGDVSAIMPRRVMAVMGNVSV